MEETKEAAVLIAAYNRPQYLKQVVKSIEKNQESTFLDFFFYLDGGSGSTQKKNIEIINQSLITNKYIINRPKNLGVGINIIDARRTLFDVYRYDRILVLEDDMVLSPYYIGLVFRLLDWAESHFDNIGVVQCWFPCTWERNKKIKHLQSVCVNFNHFWGYALSRKVWDCMKDLLYEYEERFLKDLQVYKQRDHEKIRKFFREIAQKTWPERGPRKWPEEYDRYSYFKRNFKRKNIATSQDVATGLALWSQGYRRVGTLVNRGLAIGKVGEHFTEAKFEKKGLNRVVLDTFEEDASISSFVPTDREGNVLENFQPNSFLPEEPNNNLKKVSVNSQNNIFARARQLKQQKKIEEAISIYNQAITRNPNFAWTYYLLGETLEEANRFNEAFHAYSKAVELSPNSDSFSAKLECLSKEVTKQK